MIKQPSEAELNEMKAILQWRSAYDEVHYIEHGLWAGLAAQWGAIGAHFLGDTSIVILGVCVGIVGCYFLYRALWQRRAAEKLLHERKAEKEAWLTEQAWKICLGVDR